MAFEERRLIRTERTRSVYRRGAMQGNGWGANKMESRGGCANTCEENRSQRLDAFECAVRGIDLQRRGFSGVNQKLGMVERTGGNRITRQPSLS